MTENPNQPKTPNAKSRKEIIAEIVNDFTETSTEKKQQIAETESAWKDAADRDAAQISNDKQRAELAQLTNDNEGRKHFSECIFTMMIIWMFLVLMIVINVSMKKIYLSDNVIITLLTTTSANIIGLFAIVVRYFFKK